MIDIWLFISVSQHFIFAVRFCSSQWMIVKMWQSHCMIQQECVRIMNTILCAEKESLSDYSQFIAHRENLFWRHYKLVILLFSWLHILTSEFVNEI